MKKNNRKLANVFNLFVIVLILITSWHNVAFAKPAEQDLKPRIGYSDTTGKVTFIGADPSNPISIRSAQRAGLKQEDRALAMVSQYASDFGLKNPSSELNLISTDQVDGRNVTRFQQVYQGIPIIAGEMIVHATENAELLSLSGEIAPDLDINPKPTITAQQATETAAELIRKAYEHTAAEVTFTTPELWIYDSRLLQPDGTAPALVWRIEAQSKTNLPLNEFILIDATRGHIVLNFNQVDTAWNEAGAGKVENEDTPQTATPTPFQLANTANAMPSIVKYDDLVVDEIRSRLYGADKAGNKVDVISMTDLSIISSYSLVNGAAPISLDISPDGNELAIAQSSIGFVKFINLTNDTITETPSALSGAGTKVTDVIYGRTGVLYAFTNNGLHVINLTVTPHAEDVSQYVLGIGSYSERYGAISSDNNTLYYVTGTCCSGNNGLFKYDVSSGLAKPFLINQTGLSETGYMKGIRLNLIDDSTLLITSGSVYNTSDLTPKAKNFQSLQPASRLSGKSFYVTLYDETTIMPDTLFFFDKLSSYKVSSLSTGIIGTPGAIAATNDGNTLFISSTGGMTKISISSTPPGTAIGLPSSMRLYNDLVVDLPRNVVYGTDPSGRIDVIDLNTTAIVNSYLLPSGANPKGIDLSPDGSELAIALNGLAKILFINPETGEKIAEITPNQDSTKKPFDLIYGKNNRLYANGNEGIDYIYIVNSTTHTWIGQSPYPNTIRTSTEFILNQNKTYLYANQTFSPNNLYIYDVQTDVVTKLYQGPHGPVSATKFTIIPDGSKVFTSNGQVWDSILQSQLGTLQGAPGELIEYIPNLNLIALSAPGQGSDVIKIISPVNYSLLSTITPSVLGEINEMEVSSDGSKLVVNVNNQIVVINLNISSPTSISMESGSNQTAPLQSQFQQPLKVRVSNLLGNPLSGVTVTYTAPASGPSGVFGSTNSTTAITDVNGIATSPAFTANNIFGAYQVYASVSGVDAPVTFMLLNGSITLNVSTYTLAQTTGPLPGQLLCDELNPNCTNGVNLDADAAHRFAIDTYMYYLTNHGRQSIDNLNMEIISSVDYGSGYQNAFWSGTQMVYGDGYSLADDVVAHELTHGVTQYESNLFYYYQSGAINESLSDVWGELFDQENGFGNDSPSAKWQMGEDLPIGAIRSMSNPPAYGDPDKMTSPYYNTTSSDSGGVHTNSGINNKAVFLLVDGGTFNGKTINAIGIDKTLAIYYEVQTNMLTSGADYADLYQAVYQGCLNLVDGSLGITSNDCQQVRYATDAVEMNSQPIPNFNSDAPLCTVPGAAPISVFTDDLESGVSNWSFNNGSYPRWQYDSPYGPFAHSGTHSLYAFDYPAVITDATASIAPVTIPNNAYLHFSHAFGFESYQAAQTYYDGGVIEYSINGSTSWADAGSLVDYNGYGGSINPNYGNPLANRSAFVGDSHGYISTRLNLSSLAGQSVIFRWRMGLDNIGFAGGWWVDDIQIYNCIPFIPQIISITRTTSSPLNATSVDFTVTFSEDVTGVSTSAPFEDFELDTSGVTGASITGVSGSGSVYTVSVSTGTGGGTLRLDIPASATITDLGGNALSGLPYSSGETYNVFGFQAMSQWTSDMTYVTGGWDVNFHPRMVGDVNNDGREDLIGFGNTAVWVALSNGTSFAPMTQWTSDMTYMTGGWDVKYHPRMVGDVNNDGREDLIGFGNTAVWVALSNGTSFAPMTQWTSDMTYLTGGWDVNYHPRTVGDVNNDGRDDLIGFGNTAVWVALSNGTSFAPMTQWTSDMTYMTGGWDVKYHPRMVGDVNNDGRDDLIGFGNTAVWVALSNGTSFAPMTQWTSDMTYVTGGWDVNYHPRTVGDVNNDGRDDLIGFGNTAVWVALSNGTSFAPMSQWTSDMTYMTGGWDVNYHPRTVGDVNNDGKVDLVGFGNTAVWVARAR